MKKILSILAVVSLFAFPAKAQYENTKIAVGQKAPELAYPNPSGKIVSLAEVNKGRYILLDFWASWCGPCRRSNPELVATYNKYRNLRFRNAPNGFTVFSVSLDGNKDAWLRAIQMDGLAWEYHVSDLKKWDSEAAAAYGIQFIPQAFLIGPDGKVLGKYGDAVSAAAALEQYLDKGTQVKASTTKAVKKAKK